MMAIWKRVVALKMMRSSGGFGDTAEIQVMRFVGGVDVRYKKNSHG